MLTPTENFNKTLLPVILSFSPCAPNPLSCVTDDLTEPEVHSFLSTTICQRHFVLFHLPAVPHLFHELFVAYAGVGRDSEGV